MTVYKFFKTTFNKISFFFKHLTTSYICQIALFNSKYCYRTRQPISSMNVACWYTYIKLHSLLHLIFTVENAQIVLKTHYKGIGTHGGSDILLFISSFDFQCKQIIYLYIKPVRSLYIVCHWVLSDLFFLYLFNMRFGEDETICHTLHTTR